MKKFISILIAFVVIFTLSSCANVQKSDWQEHLDLGQKYLLDGDYEQAIIEFNKVIEIEPKNVDAYLGLAEAYVAAGDYDSAKMAIQKGIENCGSNNAFSEALNSLNSPYSSDQIESAQPDLPVYEDGLGFLNDLNYDSAVSLFEQFYNDADYGVKAYIKVAQIYASEGKYEEAERTLNEAQEVYGNLQVFDDTRQCIELLSDPYISSFTWITDVEFNKEDYLAGKETDFYISVAYRYDENRELNEDLALYIATDFVDYDEVFTPGHYAVYGYESLHDALYPNTQLTEIPLESKVGWELCKVSILPQTSGDFPFGFGAQVEDRYLGFWIAEDCVYIDENANVCTDEQYKIEQDKFLFTENMLKPEELLIGDNPFWQVSIYDVIDEYKDYIAIWEDNEYQPLSHDDGSLEWCIYKPRSKYEAIGILESYSKSPEDNTIKEIEYLELIPWYIRNTCYGMNLQDFLNDIGISSEGTQFLTDLLHNNISEEEHELRVSLCCSQNSDWVIESMTLGPSKIYSAEVCIRYVLDSYSIRFLCFFDIDEKLRDVHLRYDSVDLFSEEQEYRRFIQTEANYFLPYNYYMTYE